DPVNATGPCALSKTIEQHGGVEHLGIGIMPSEWINPLPDMAWNFSENEPYDLMIRQGTWREALNPFVAHYWWHSSLNGHCTFERYGNSTFPPREPAGSVPLAFL